MASKSESLRRGTKQEKEERQAFAATPSDGVEGQNPATRKREKAKAEKVDEDVREAWKMKREGASDDDILNYFIQEGKSIAKTVKILAALGEPAPVEDATSEEPAPSRIPDTGQSWIQPASMGMQQVQQQQQQQAQAGDPGETPQATPEPAATPTAPGNGPTKAEKEQAEKIVRSAAFRALKYREMGIKDDDITQNLQEGGMTPELISQTFALMNSIERGRIYKAKDRARVEKEQQRQERREMRNLGASLGQVETKRGATWEEPKEAAPIGRERAPFVPVSQEPLVQVETRPAQEAKLVETDSTDPTLLLTYEKKNPAPKRVKSPPESHPTIALGYEPSEGTPLDALMSSVEPEPVSEPILRIGYTERAPRAKRVREANEIMPTIHLGYERDDKVEETKEIKSKLSKGTIPPSVSRVVKSMDTTRSYASKKAAAAAAAAAASIAAIIRNKEAGERVPTTSSLISDTLPEQFERTPTHKAATAYIDSLSNPQSSSDGRGADTPVLETKAVSGKDEVHPAPVASDSDPFTLTDTERAGFQPLDDEAAGVDTSGVLNPYMVQPGVQTEYDALKADIHTSVYQEKIDEEIEKFKASGMMIAMPTIEPTEGGITEPDATAEPKTEGKLLSEMQQILASPMDNLSYGEVYAIRSKFHDLYSEFFKGDDALAPEKWEKLGSDALDRFYSAYDARTSELEQPIRDDLARNPLQTDKELAAKHGVSLNDVEKMRWRIDWDKKLGHKKEEASLRQRERKEFPLDEVEALVREQLKGKAKINHLDVTQTPEGVHLHAELDAGMAGGKIELDGIIANEGDFIAVDGLDIKARGYVKSMIEGNLSGFGTAIRLYFEKQYGKPVSSIQIGASGLTVEFENSPLMPDTSEKEAQKDLDDSADHPDTPLEWRNKLKGLIEGAKEKMNMSERGEQLKNYLAERASIQVERAKDLGPKMEAFIRARGEEYNKLSLTKKILIGGALGVGAAAFSGVSTPLATAFAVNLGIQRFGGMASMFLKFEKYLQDHKGSNIGMGLLRVRDEKIKGAAAFGAIAYTAFMGAAIGEGVHLASESSYGQAVHEWLGKQMGLSRMSVANTNGETSPAPSPTPDTAPAPTSPASAPGSAAPAAEATRATPTAAPAASPAVTVPAGSPPSTGAEGGGGTAAPAPVAQPEAPALAQTQPAAAAAAGTEVAPSATVMEASKIEVKATPGKGYEYMTKRLWEQLQEKNIKLPSGANPDSDLAKLLTADKNSIDKVVHELAQANEYYKQNGTSVRIGLDSRMSIDANGDITLDGNPVAPEDAPVTPVYRAESPAVTADTSVVPRPETPAVLSEIERVEVTPSAPVVPVETVTQTVEHNLIVNKFDVTIPTAEPHVYSDGSNMLVYGGSAAEQSKKILEYLSKNPTQTVLSGDDAGKYRIPWRVVEGKLVPGEPLRTNGLLGLLRSFVPPPSPEEFKEVVD